MPCRKCGYELQPFETECPRCAREKQSRRGPSEAMSRSAQEAMMKEARRYEKSQAPTELTTVRIIILILLFLAGVSVPLIFGKHAWENSQVSLVTTAAKNGNLQRVKSLIEGNPKLINAPGYLGRPALYWAAAYGHTEIAKYLLSQKADINMGDANDWTPLFGAAQHDKESMVIFLFDNKAKLLAKDKEGKTALHIAARYNSTKCMDFMVKNGLKIETPDNTGRTALHDAARFGKVKSAEMLLDLGADLNAKTKAGETPLHLANELKRNDEMIAFLSDRGAAE